MSKYDDFEEYSDEEYNSEDYKINFTDNVGGFKVGEKVKPTKDSWYFRHYEDEVLTVFCFRKSKNRIGLLRKNSLNEGGEGDLYLEPKDLQYDGVPDNVLSRKLYPNWVSNGKYLVPRVIEEKK